jgi:hypothetical protein
MEFQSETQKVLGLGLGWNGIQWNSMEFNGIEWSSDYRLIQSNQI